MELTKEQKVMILELIQAEYIRLCQLSIEANTNKYLDFVQIKTRLNKINNLWNDFMRVL